MAEQLEHNDWKGTTGGMPWMQRSLVHILAVIHPLIIYSFVAVFVIPFYMLFSHASYLSQYHYFRQRWNEPWYLAFWHVYVNHLLFAQVVVDRFAMYGGRHFRFEMDGYDHWLSLEKQPEGFVQLSSHVGNYELAGYSLKAERKQFNALVFMGETETVMRNRRSQFTPNNINMIPVMPDMSHIFVLNNALAEGQIVSMPSDRIFGSQKSLTCRLLDAEAKFPQGPFAMILARQCPAMSVFVMKKDWRTYHIVIRDITEGLIGSQKWNEARKAERMQMLADAFVSQLDAILHQYPTQWYNYFEFWQ